VRAGADRLPDSPAVAAHRVVVTWCADTESHVRAVLPHRPEPLRAGSEEDLRGQVDRLLTDLYGPGGYEVAYRRVPVDSLGV
jgi:hypothetical protein